MTATAILCGGQGTQSRDMFAIVADQAAAQPVFAAAELILGSDPRAFAREADEAALHANKASQILCCTLSVAVWSCLDLPRRDLTVAGYSVGEIAAWACAGLFDAATMMRILAARADAMDAAAANPGGLASVSGLRRSDVDRLCTEHDLHVAIIIASDRFVVGGSRDDLDPFCAAASGAGAHRAAPIAVHVASHTPLLAEATRRFGATLNALPVPHTVPAGVRLLSGIDGACVYDVSAGLQKLAKQLSQPVDWAACLDNCKAGGAETYLDLGPGRALSAMAADALPGARVHAVSDFRSIEGIRKWVQRGR